MYSLAINLMSIMAFGIVVIGLAMEFSPAIRKAIYSWRRPAISANLLIFASGIIVLGVFGGQDAMAAAAAAADASPFIQHQATAGMGLELVGVGIPTACAAIGAGVAVGQIGSASLAVVAEKPEMFGRTLIFLGLGEGIAIYGLVMSILLLGKL